MRELTNDPRGTADWIEREARGMDPMQLYGEFVQNGIEAGGNRIVIDGWTDPETGHVLARITDNGTGLTSHQLIERLSCLHGKFKGDTNYGVGARIAALPSNHAGVSFASRTATSEAMMTLHKDRGRFGVKQWEVEDADGYAVMVETVLPDDGMLDRVDGETGTAVILHGNGHEDTWNTSTSYQVHKFLTRRYYDFGAGVDILVHHANQLRAVVPVGEYLAGYSEADGEVPFRNIAGLNGVMFWWIIPSATELQDVMQSAKIVPGGVGLVAENEIFDYSKSYLGDFGLIYASVQARVAILIFIDGAEMGTARADLILPGQNRKNVPWKRLGAFFAENMPEEIDALLSRITVTSASLDVEVAKMLDKDWMQKLNPVLVNVPAREGESSTGSNSGESPPAGNDIELDGRRGESQNRKRRAAERKHTGDEPGKPKLKTVTPQVKFTPDFPYETHPFGISWFPVENIILIAEDFPPYVREVERWREKVKLPRQQIETYVMWAYQVEYGATIIDANVQAKFKLTPDMVEQLKSDASLYAKALGMQSLHERIAGFIKNAAKNG